MDLSMLPAPVSEYDNQRTGARFTVRPANSLPYSLTTRPAVGTPTCVLEDKNYQARTGRPRSEKRRREKEETPGYKTSTELNQNGTADQTVPVSGSDMSRTCNPASESQGGTHLRRLNRASRSMSLDRRAEASSPYRGKITDVFVLQTKRGEEPRRTEPEGPRGRTKPSMQPYNPAGTSDVQESSPVSHMRQTLDRASKGKSLPTRLRSLSGSGPGLQGSAMLGPEGGQSILERIEKLFGSAGFGKPEDWFPTAATSNHKETSSCSAILPQQAASGGTFPMRFSSGEERGVSPLRRRKSITWTDKDTTCSEASFSPKTSRAHERRSGAQGQGQIQSRHSGVGGGNAGLEDTGTRSLDRARGRDSIAAQKRSARATAGITAPPHVNSSLEEKRPELSGSWVGRAIGTGSKDGGETNGTQGTLRGRTEWLEEQGETTDQVAREITELKMSSSDEEVFDPSPQKVTKKSLEKNEFSAAAASVRNKIHQFEALTQRAQGVAAGQVRRAFSVPTQFGKLHEGVKKSGSEKAIGGSKYRWEGLKEGGEADDETEDKTQGKISLGSNRSFSVDEIGLRLGREENKGKEMDSKNICDFGKSSSLRTTLEVPLKGGAQRKRTNFDKDEIDSHRTSSREEQSEGPLISHPSDSTAVQETTAARVTSLVDDEDVTPTNSPYVSPALTPTTQPKSLPFGAHSGNGSASALTPAAEIPKRDSWLRPRPLASSSHGDLPDLLSPDSDAAKSTHEKKQLLDLKAWVAGLRPGIAVWSDNEEDYEEDDDSTERDEDSNYDSDSGESSVTVTSNMSQTDHKSFCLSLADLRNFAGVDGESENDIDEWQCTDRRTASLSSDMSAFSSVSVMPSEELDRLLEDVRSTGDSALQDVDDVQVVVLHKDLGVGLGFSVAGGVDQNKPITVHKVFPSGVAAQEGSIREGDLVLSINGTALCGYTHWEVLRVLRRAKTREMGVVVFRRGGMSSVRKRRAETNNQDQAQTQFNETGQHVRVRLEKNTRDLGFSLEGGVGSKLGNRPLTIQKIFQGGPVDKVRPGDELEEIEGTSVVGMRRLEAWTLIRGLPSGPVDVVLRRTLKHLET